MLFDNKHTSTRYIMDSTLICMYSCNNDTSGVKVAPRMAIPNRPWLIAEVMETIKDIERLDTEGYLHLSWKLRGDLEHGRLSRRLRENGMSS